MTVKTQSDGYEPTLGERKLLDVLLNPDHRYLNKRAICKEAGVHHTKYYDAFKKPEFVDYYKAQCFDLINQGTVAAVHALEKAAKAGSFQHIKLLLEMAQMHSDKLDVNFKGHQSNFNTDDPKEAAQAYSELVKRTER